MSVSKIIIRRKVLPAIVFVVACLGRPGVNGQVRLTDWLVVLAGNGTAGFAGDGGPAVAAKLNNPEGMTVDALGNIFIADTGNHRIRKVTPDGVISTVAGNSTAGFSGDGGPATSATLNSPMDVAVDSSGNLYIADFNNRRIRKVAADGMIQTIAGNDGMAGTGDGGPAIAAGLWWTMGVAVDKAGNVFFSESSFYDVIGEHIRKVDTAGIISTVAGGGSEDPGDGGPATSAFLEGPGDIVVDAGGDLYFTDHGRIRKVTSAGVITTVAGNGTPGFSGDGGLAVQAKIFPSGIAIDQAGNLYIAEGSNNCIREVTQEGIIRTVLDQLKWPSALSVSQEGNIFLAELKGNRILGYGEQFHVASSHFPEIAVGGGWSTLFTIINIGAAEADVELALYDPQGNPLTVEGQFRIVNGITEPAASASVFQCRIPAGGTVFLSTRLQNPAEGVRIGWALFRTVADGLTAFATYEYESGGSLRCMTSVPPSPLLQYATIPVDDNSAESRYLAYAIANPGLDPISVRLDLLAQDGTLEGMGTTIELGPGEQIARYLFQDVAHTEFRGSVALQCPDGQRFVVVALYEKQGLFTTLPIVPGKH